jgi:hypothetical protein
MFLAKSKRKSINADINKGLKRGRPCKKARLAKERNESSDEASKIIKIVIVNK